MDSGYSHGEFPSFEDADVLIVLSASRLYRLHSWMIRKNIPCMGPLLTEVNSAPGIKKGGRKFGNSNLRWRIDLEVHVDAPANFLECHFVLGEVDQNGQTQPVNSAQETRALKLHRTVFKHYDNLFRVIYGENVDYGIGLFSTLKTCMGIVAVGDDVGALKSICRELEKVLLQFDKDLWKAIAYNPVCWANFANKLQSAVLFKDAMVHLVGKWKLLDFEARAKLDGPVRKVCRAKVLDFQREKQAIEVRMLGHYSFALRKNDEQEKIKRGATGNPSRSVYANEIYGWMALGFFRQWFAQVICEGNNFRARDGGYRLYKALNEGGHAYLTDGDLDGFYYYFPMSDKAKGVMDKHLIFFKEDMKELVAPLFENNSHYSHPEKLQYLLSAKVADEDCPWMAPAGALEGSVSLDDDDPDFRGSMLDSSIGFNHESPLADKGVRLPVRSLQHITPSDGSADGRLGSALLQAQLKNATDEANADDDHYRRVSELTNQSDGLRSQSLFVSGNEPAEEVSLANGIIRAQSDPPTLSNIQSPMHQSNTITRASAEAHSSNEALPPHLMEQSSEHQEGTGIFRAVSSDIMERQNVERSLSHSPGADNAALTSDGNGDETVKME